MPLYSLKALIPELTSPVTTNAKYPFYLGSTLTILTLGFEDKVVDPIQNEVVEDKPLGKYSIYGDLMGQLIPNATYFIFSGVIGLAQRNRTYLSNAGEMFSATLYSGAVITLLKYTIREKRPNSNVRNSFPSGHTTMAFAFASVVGMNHPWYYGILAYSMAAVVGFSRINDNYHWLHDVIAGATIGTAYGVGICSLRNGGGGGRSYSQYLIPVPVHHGSMLTYTLHF